MTISRQSVKRSKLMNNSAIKMKKEERTRKRREYERQISRSLWRARRKLAERRRREE